MPYQGPAITPEEEFSRAHYRLTDEASTNWTIEPGIITEFREGNRVNVRMSDGVEYNDVQLKTPLSFVQWFLGEPEYLKMIPCVLIFKTTPEEGFVDIGKGLPDKLKPEDELVNEPFFV